MAFYVVEDDDEFFLNATGTECAVVAFREFVDGRNTRTVWVLPDGRIGRAGDPLDLMTDGIPSQHGYWPANTEIRWSDEELRLEPQVAPLVFEVLWQNAGHHPSELVVRTGARS